MARHLADHRAPSQGARITRFVAIDRAGLGEGGRAGGDSDGSVRGLWRDLARRPVGASDTNRRLVEFLRITRGRQV